MRKGKLFLGGKNQLLDTTVMSAKETPNIERLEVLTLITKTLPDEAGSFTGERSIVLWLRHGIITHNTWVLVLALPQVSCLTLGK